MFTEGLSEIVLVVEDVPAAAEFYREVVGLTPEIEADQEWAWFWTGQPGASQRLALHKGSLLFGEHSPQPKGDRWGQVHFAFRVPHQELQAAVVHLRRHDIEVHGPTYFEWMQAESYYFFDPDGNLLEFWSPVPENAGV